MLSLLRSVLFLASAIGAAASNRTVGGCAHHNLSTTVMLSSNQTGRRLLPKSSVVSFYAMGDAPYGFHESTRLFPRQIANMDPDEAEFAIHLGDMQDRTAHCRQQDYHDMRQVLERSQLPMFIIPGDNDHYDCLNRHRGFHFWEKHLGRLHENWPMPFRVRNQESRPENFAFSYKRVLFLSVHTLHRKSIKNRVEWDRIERQNLKWTLNQIANWEEYVSAVVIFSHAYPTKVNYPKYWKGLSDRAASLDIPFLLLQGDAHRWVEDYPFKAKNILRVVVDRGGWADPVRITIDPDSAQPFKFQRRPLSKLK